MADKHYSFAIAAYEGEENSVTSMLENIQSYFAAGTFCDLTIFGQDGTSFKGRQCHSLIICSVAPALRNLLIDENEERYLFLPDISYEIIQKFLVDVYDGLTLTDFSLNIPDELWKAFGMNGNEEIYKENLDLKPKTEEQKVENFEIVVESEDNVKNSEQIELVLPENAEESIDGTYLVDTTSLSEQSISVILNTYNTISYQHFLESCGT